MPRQHASSIVIHLRELIEGGQYKPMERLPASRELAESLGVARNTLRDALYQLEKEGILETRPGSGTYVKNLKVNTTSDAVKDASPLELIDARFAFEPHVCRLIVLHAHRDDFEELEALCNKMEKSTLDPVAFAEADMLFHRALATSTKNKLLIWLIHQISEVRAQDEWTRMRQLTLDERMITLYNTQHRAILDALRAREPETAAVSMKDHLETARLSLTRAAET